MLPTTTRSIRIASLALLCLAAAVSAQDRRLAPNGGAGRRMALIIGNDNYPWKPLKNAVNDAKSLAALLPSVGFSQRDITLVTDASLKQMQRAGREFVESLRADDLAFIFYSGHGVEVRGENFLIPTDFPSNASELEVQDDAYSAQQFLRNLESSPAKTRIVILDACRDNPLRASRSAGGGLARMDGKGTLIVYATSAGSTADDNARGQNGLFTSHLLKALPTPGVKMRELMDDVARDVYRDSGEKQLPAIYGLLLEDFPLVASGVPALHVDPATEAWNGIKDSTNPVDFERFAQAFPASDLAATAHFNAERLRRPTPAPVDVPRSGPTVPIESHYHQPAVVASTPMPPPHRPAPVQEKAQRKWQDKDEYESFQQVQSATDPQARFAALKAWEDKYPSSDYTSMRLDFYIDVLSKLAASDLNRRRDLLDKCQETLNRNPAHSRAMFMVSLWGPVVGGSSPSVALLSQVDSAARDLIANVDSLFPESAKPSTTTSSNWDKGKALTVAQAHNALGWVATINKEFPAAESEYRLSLMTNPDDATISARLGKLLVNDKNYPEALFHYARAGYYTGPGPALSAEGRQTALDYFNMSYRAFHGSDDGIERVVTQARSSALPPADFDISRFQGAAK
jgi:hypothetical protein